MFKSFDMSSGIHDEEADTVRQASPVPVSYPEPTHLQLGLRLQEVATSTSTTPRFHPAVAMLPPSASEETQSLH